MKFLLENIKLMVEQQDLLDGITDTLTELKTTTRIGVVLGMLFWWAGFSKDDPIKILDAEIHRKHALFIAATIYLGLTYIIWDRFHRVGTLLIELEDQYIEKAFSKLNIHPWILNPFSYFGNDITSRLTSAKGFGLLSLLWWVCNSSIISLANYHMTYLIIAVQLLYLAIGLATMKSYFRVNNILLERMKPINYKVYSVINSRRKDKICLDLIGTILGITFCALMRFFLI